MAHWTKQQFHWHCLSGPTPLPCANLVRTGAKLESSLCMFLASSGTRLSCSVGVVFMKLATRFLGALKQSHGIPRLHGTAFTFMVTSSYETASLLLRCSCTHWAISFSMSSCTLCPRSRNALCILDHAKSLLCWACYQRMHLTKMPDFLSVAMLFRHAKLPAL